MDAPLFDDSCTARGTYCVALEQKLTYAQDKASATFISQEISHYPIFVGTTVFCLNEEPASPDSW